MAVVINVNGNSSGGSGTNPNPNPSGNSGGQTTGGGNYSGGGGTTANSGGSTPLPPDNRLVEEVRRAIIAQGALFVPGNNTYKPIINQVEQTQRKLVDQSVQDKYNQRRTNLNDRWDSEIEAKNQELSDLRNQELQGVSSPTRIKKINRKWDKIEEDEIKKINESYNQEESKINIEQEKERLEKQDELTQVMKDLTEAINKSGSLNPNSYLGQLRAQRQEAIFERDTADDEETARAAAERVKEIDQQIKDTTDGKQPEEKKIDWGNRTLQTMLGFDQLARGITGKDAGSIIMGSTQTLLSAFGASDETSAKTLAWMKPIATIGTLLTQEGQRSDQMSGLAALIRGGNSISNTRDDMFSNLWNYSAYNVKPNGDIINPYGINAMGMSVPEFAQSAERRISQRMTIQDGVSEAYYQEALERVFSLNRGSLGAAGKFDRYGTNVTDAFSGLIRQLESIQGSGITKGNYVRAQEYLEGQQSMMEYYKRYANIPQYGAANLNILQLAKLATNNPHYTYDDRSVGEYQALNSQITNPKNDRMKSILYGVVEENVKTYKGQNVAGRSDLIDQIINDPSKMDFIRTKFMEKLTDMYGGTDSPLGYWMVKSQTGMENPERMIELWNGFLPGGKAMRGTNGSVIFNGAGPGTTKEEYSKEVANYVSDMTKDLITISDGIYKGVGFLQKILDKLTSLM